MIYLRVELKLLIDSSVKFLTIQPLDVLSVIECEEHSTSQRLAEGGELLQFVLMLQCGFKRVLLNDACQSDCRCEWMGCYLDREC